MKTLPLFLTTITAATLLMTSCSKKDKTTPDPDPVNPVDTALSGNVSGTWAKDGTYHITGDVIVPEGQTLTIEAGAKIIFDTTAKPEFLVKGNLYAVGTDAEPVIFTVDDDKKSTWGMKWGGIMGGPTCGEILLDHCIIEQGGNVTTEASASVNAQFYKAEAGDRVPVLWYGGTGKVVVTHCTVRNFGEDGFYIEGGSVIVDHNTIYTTGLDNGDAINIKSGVHADVAFNTVYSPNTNALKLSNSGDRPINAYIYGYNNTIINCGWRRATTKGGSIWVEKGVIVELYNNLLVNDRYGIKRDKTNTENAASKFGNTLYYGYNQTTVDQFQPSEDIITGVDDIISTVVGANDPKFVNFPLSNDMSSAAFNTSWDFHLQSGSPAVGHGKTNFTSFFVSTGLSFGNGSTYTSPAPANYIGAWGTN
ncbi:right-handed parallel beta-helix repeat-containing protein [Taibaiella lutea]|uniref:Right-handed parallel beta-helix repeat-containing protein n=1 Tax=Taibaiella lutea TaxID=2608001 RepID=A0A5M6CVF2_9BACT|nr:right-handed parallel beta-helix repeat-containing protein [Taibaiella lutea]KAA5537189.1 right-handed parallel beta-helix repeat-containing protein [Taibaiella lutea]